MLGSLFLLFLSFLLGLTVWKDFVASIILSEEFFPGVVGVRQNYSSFGS